MSEPRATLDPGRDVGDVAEDAAQEVHDSRALAVLARTGLAGRGLLWLVIAWLALQVLLGRPREADQQSALKTIAGAPLGELLLWAVAAGLAGYATWRFLRGLLPRHGDHGWFARFQAVAEGVLYTFGAYGVVHFLLGGERTSGDQAAPLTARVLGYPGGREAVGAVGVVFLVVAAFQVRHALGGDHVDHLDRRRLGPTAQRALGALGAVGLMARSLVVVLAGLFLVAAAVTARPSEARGLDRLLDTVATHTAGFWGLGAAVAGLVLYGVWSFVDAAYRDLHPDRR